jgi:DNA polymerase III sliding clamp (beta) subunit (PCNA family)
MTAQPQEAPMVARVALKAHDLRRAMANAALFASKDSTFPALCAVRLEISDDGTELVAVGTDRFMLGADAVPCACAIDGEGRGGVSALIDRLDAERIAKAIKAGKPGRDDYLRLTLTGGDTVTVETGDVTMTVRQVDGAYPKWRGLIPGPLADSEQCVARVGLTTKLVAAFTKVEPAWPGAPMELSLRHPSKPIRVKIGETFVGILMPYKLSGASS